MGYKIPWSNFHELNLDWLLEQVKKLREDVDSIIGSATPSTSIPEMDGIGSPGTEDNYARGDHRHPTDTSRAAQSDLTQEITDRGNADLALASDIADVDAKIKFSAAAPIMDSSSASAGFSDYMARADHIHPTDTSRASATDVATLTARMDAFAGSANPSDVPPLMDGVASAGTVGAYSRGDHVHPADSSKLDVAGGTITGNLRIEGSLREEQASTYLHSNVVSWIRVATVPNVQGTQLDIHIQKKGALTPSEFHDIKLEILSGGPVFSEEHSLGDSLYIDKIRYSSAGYVDIHSDQTYDCDISIYIEPHAPTASDQQSISMIQSPSSVADAPAGETLTTRNFHQNTRYLTETGTSGIWDYQLYSDKYVVADAYIYEEQTYYAQYFTGMYGYLKAVSTPFTMRDTQYYVDFEYTIGSGVSVPGGVLNVTTTGYTMFGLSSITTADTPVTIRAHIEGYIA